MHNSFLFHFHIHDWEDYLSLHYHGASSTLVLFYFLRLTFTLYPCLDHSLNSSLNLLSMSSKLVICLYISRIAGVPIDPLYLDYLYYCEPLDQQTLLELLLHIKYGTSQIISILRMHSFYLKITYYNGESFTLLIHTHPLLLDESHQLNIPFYIIEFWFTDWLFYPIILYILTCTLNNYLYFSFA